MKAILYTEKLAFGEVNLIKGDISMGNWYGNIEPLESYYYNLQKPIQDFWKRAPDYSILEQLRINILLENGIFLNFRGFTIIDMVDFPNEPIRLDIVGADPYLFTIKDDFFKEPWHKIQISQKIHFEDQLLKETCHNHLLSGTKYSVLANNTMICDTLFAIIEPNEQIKSLGNYFTVHLTYSTNNYNGFPYVNFYESLEHFYHACMIKDSIDFNEPS